MGRRGEAQGGTAEELPGGEAGLEVGFGLVCFYNQLKSHHLEIDNIDISVLIFSRHTHIHSGINTQAYLRDIRPPP